jgi:hypothetical protein
MIKLFGWGKRVQQDIAAKREEELKSVEKRAIWSMVVYNVKYVDCSVPCPLSHLSQAQLYHTIRAYDCDVCYLRALSRDLLSMDQLNSLLDTDHEANANW